MSDLPKTTMTFEEAAQAHVQEQSEGAPVPEREEAPQADLQDDSSMVEDHQQAADDAELSEPLDDDQPEDDQDLSDEDDSETVDEFDDSDDDGGEPTVTIREDGRELEVTLTELKRGYIRERTFTKKTMDLAAQRQTAEAKNEQIAQLEQTNLAILQGISQHYAGNPVAAPDPRLLDTDERAYIRQKAEHDQWQANLAQNQQWTSEVAQQIQQREQQAYQAKVAEEFPKILKEWNLPDAQAQEAVTRITDLQQSSAQAYGLPQQFFAKALDHGLYLALEDAQKWRELKAGGNQKAMSKMKRKGIKPIRSGRANVKPKKQSLGEVADKRFEQTVNQFNAGEAPKRDIFAEAAKAHQAQYRK